MSSLPKNTSASSEAEKLTSKDTFFLITLNVTSFILVVGAIMYLGNLFYSVIALVGLITVLTYMLLGPVRLFETGIGMLSNTMKNIPRFGDFSKQTPQIQPRLLAVILVYFIFISIVVTASIRLVPALGHQLTDFGKDLTRYANKSVGLVVDWSDKALGGSTLKHVFDDAITEAQIEGKLEKKPSPVSRNPINKKTESNTTNPNGVIGPTEKITDEEKKVIQKSVFKTTLSQATFLTSQAIKKGLHSVLVLSLGTLKGFIYFLSGFILLFYFLLDGESLSPALIRILPNRQKEVALYFVTQFHRVMYSFIKGQVLLGIVTGVYMFIIYSIFGVPYALLLSILLALFEILPVIGTFLGLAPAILVMLFTIGPVNTFFVWLCSYLFQTVKDNILAPKIVGDAMGLHPLVVIVSILICARLGGVVGVLLALPLASVINVILRYYSQDETSPIH